MSKKQSPLCGRQGKSRWWPAKTRVAVSVPVITSGWEAAAASLSTGKIASSAKADGWSVPSQEPPQESHLPHFRSSSTSIAVTDASIPGFRAIARHWGGRAGEQLAKSRRKRRRCGAMAIQARLQGVLAGRRAPLNQKFMVRTDFAVK